MIVKSKAKGWLVLGVGFALWPPLIASSFAYLPQPLASFSAIAHGGSFIFVALFGIYLLLPDQRHFDSPLPPLADRPGELFRQGRNSVEEGGVNFSGVTGNETKATGGSEGRSLPSTFATESTERYEKSGERSEEK